jgi:hypothetical protein
VQPDRERLSEEPTWQASGFDPEVGIKIDGLRLVLGGSEDTVVMFQPRGPSEFEWTVLICI